MKLYPPSSQRIRTYVVSGPTAQERLETCGFRLWKDQILLSPRPKILLEMCFERMAPLSPTQSAYHSWKSRVQGESLRIGVQRGRQFRLGNPSELEHHRWVRSEFQGP